MIKQIIPIINSGNLNFLIGAGASHPFLPILGDIEQRINQAEEDRDDDELIKQQKRYYKDVMYPNKKMLLNAFTGAKLQLLEETLKAYNDFFKALSSILLSRGSSILGKQANIFTTNIDALQELALENLGIDYCDGFIGNINPVFSASNYKRSIMQRSLHFDNISEIPIFNIIKLHGSLTWSTNMSGEINYSDCRNLFEVTNDDILFKEQYSKIQIINPGVSKYADTVLTQIYFDLLRTFSSELEKENAVLFVFGFSMRDQHIRQIILRAADSNPTLNISIFCHSKTGAEEISDLLQLDERRYKNICLIKPEGSIINYDMEVFAKVFSNLLTKND